MGIILALFLVSVIIPLVSFLLIVRKRKIRTSDQKIQLSSTRQYQQALPLSDPGAEICQRDLRCNYEQHLKQDTLILDALPQNKTSAKNAAEVISSMANLRTLIIDGCSGDSAEDFYSKLAVVSPSSKIETLVHVSGDLSPVSSRNYAGSVFSLPRLRILNTLCVNLDDTFYETMAKLGHQTSQSQMEKLGIMFGHEHGSNAARNLATGISSLPHLSSLYLNMCFTNVLLNEMCNLITTSPSSFKISTVILANVVMTRRNMETILSLDSLRSIRFVRVFSSHRSQMKQKVGLSNVTELSMDTLSLPQLIKLGVHEYCSRVQKVQLDITSQMSNDVMMNLSKFSSASHLYFVGHLQHAYLPVYEKIEVKDTSSLCHCLKDSWPRLVSLVMADVMMGDSEARTMLKFVGTHGSLKNITMTRCGTTDALNAYLGQMKDDVMVTLTHGEPITLRTIEERDEYHIQRSRQAVFDVITVDHEQNYDLTLSGP